MSSRPLIEVKNVSKLFWHRRERALLRDRIADLLHRRRDQDSFFALRDVSFEVMEGEAVALIGANGAGKSTMLSLVTGLAKPTRGSVAVHGRVVALLELGCGFHADLTGRENVFVNASLLGMSEAHTRERFEEVVRFSGIQDFIDDPVQTYSNGMLVRLAFSVAVHSDPSILIVDEVLAVGDTQFQEQCLKKVAALQRQGVTVLCVSHSPSIVTEFCERAIWLHKGQLVLDGPSGRVMLAYLETGGDPLKLQNKPVREKLARAR